MATDEPAFFDGKTVDAHTMGEAFFEPEPADTNVRETDDMVALLFNTAGSRGLKLKVLLEPDEARTLVDELEEAIDATDR